MAAAIEPACVLLHRALLGVGLAVGLAGVATAGPVDIETSVVASGLDSPRGLAFGPDGALYITEAGVASGAGPSIVVRGDSIIATSSGSITRAFGGSTTRVLTGLPSTYDATTHDVDGAQDIVFASDGSARIAIGTGFNPTLRSSLGPIGLSLGQLVKPGGASIDVSAFEVAHNPDGGALDSNPWHLARDGSSTLVTDAGANALLRVTDGGVVSSIAAFGARALGGPFPTESVPTGIAVGPDGAYYVGELTGFPFIPGAARVLRVLPDGTTSVFATGFTMITDMAFGSDGSLYVLEYDANGLLAAGDTGELWRIAPDGTESMLFGSPLVNPTGLEIGSDGAFYISNVGASSGAGEVIRVAIPEPGTTMLLIAGLLAIAGRSAARRAQRRLPGGLSG